MGLAHRFGGDSSMKLPDSDAITSLLTNYLDVQSRRAEIVAGNLANSETPGYKAKELNFADYLRRAAQDALNPQRTAERALSSTLDAPRVVEQQSAETGLDGNTVDVGREMATLAETGMQYLAGTQMLQARLRTLRAAIRDGK
jgi:flagellar basal-body rod protein FlgB